MMHSRTYWAKVFRLKRGLLWLGLEFKPGDLWIGAYVHSDVWTTDERNVDVWICLLPTLPIHFMYSA